MTSRGYRVREGVVLYPEGGVLLTDENVLVIADLHLGCEAALEYQGMSIPRVQTEKIEHGISRLLDATEPRRVVVAGDLKHNFSRNLTQEWQDVWSFVRRLSWRLDLEVVKGNHDNYLGIILREYGIPLRQETHASGARIVHGHDGRLTDDFTIMGHLHPSLRLRDGAGVSVKDPCFLYSDALGVLVLPALSIVSPGTDVIGGRCSDTMSPLLSEHGLEDFVPIAFSRGKPLRFPKIGQLRGL